MTVRRRVAAAWIAVLGLLLVLGVLSAHRWQRGLERQVETLDLPSLLRARGLPGAIVSARWERQGFRWLPRPALLLEGLEIRIDSGQPGPGAAAGRLRLDRLELIPVLDRRLHVAIGGIVARGGLIDISSDLLPRVPQSYLDPLTGERRPIPWGDLLGVAAGARLKEGPARPWDPLKQVPHIWFDSAPTLSLNKVKIRLVGLETLPGTDFRLEQTTIRLEEFRWSVDGLLRFTETDTPARPTRTIPLNASGIVRPGAGGGRWRVALGDAWAGFRFGLQTGGDRTTWTAETHDPEGRLARSYLAGSTQLLRRLEWTGPWALSGTGRLPGGLMETQVDLRGGLLQLKDEGWDAEAPPPSVRARGRLRILPGRVDIRGLSLRREDAEGESVRVDLEWLRLPRGVRYIGTLTGKIDPAWTRLLGPDWTLKGQLSCELSLDGLVDEDTGEWGLTPNGRLEAVLDSAHVPWFAETLRAARINLKCRSGETSAQIAGTWGRSPFTLEASGIPLQLPWTEVWTGDPHWIFRSPYTRLEDFRLSPERFPGVAPLPFWWALPGNGSVDIVRGSFAWVGFDSLRTWTLRRPAGFRLDTLDVRVGEGWLRAGPASRLDRFQDRRQADVPGWRLRAQNLDLASVERILKGGGIRIAGDWRGTLGGDLLLRARNLRGPEGPSLEFDGSVRASSGSVRGLPEQDRLRRLTHLDALSVLAFEELAMEVRYGSLGFSWNRMRIEAPPLWVEGAGRITSGDSLRAALAVRTSPGSDRGGTLAGFLSSLLPGGDRSLYVVIRGPRREPGLRLVGRAVFLQELDRLGAALPPGPAP